MSKNAIDLFFLLFLIITTLSSSNTTNQNKNLDSIDTASKTNNEDISRISCTCPELPKLTKKLKEMDRFPNYEIVNMQTFGLPKPYDKDVFLQGDFDVIPTTTEINVCPEGYSAITLEIFNRVIANIGKDYYEYIFLPDSIGFSQSYNYVFNNKVYPNSKVGSNGESWVFHGISFDSEAKEVKYNHFSTYYEKNLKTKCVLNSKSYNLKLRMDAKYDTIYTYNDYQLFLKNTNIITAYWTVAGETKEGLKPIFKFVDDGCNFIYINAMLLNGVLKTKCFPLYAIENWGSDEETHLNKIEVKSLSYKKDAKYYPQINLEPSNSPFSTNYKGNYLLAYSHKETEQIMIIMLNKDFKIIKEIDIQEKGRVLDFGRISDKGYAMLAKGPVKTNRVFVIYFDKEGVIQWRKDIINNIEHPTQRSENDLVFFEIKNNKSVIVQGMEAMYGTRIGSIAYANGRIGISLTRMNRFSSGQIGQADMFFTINLAGNSMKLGYSWGASPSLKTRLLSDGYDFFTASLGTQFPKNIQVCQIMSSTFNNLLDSNGKHYKHKRKCFNLLKENIPSDVKGYSCGRLGGFVYKNGIYGITYSRKPCAIKAENGTIEQSSMNSFGLVLFDKDFNIKRRIYFGKGSQVICLNSALFGKHLLIQFTVTTKAIGLGPPPNEVDQATDSSYIFLVNFNGVVISKPMKLNKATCDDFQTLKHGGIAYTHVSAEGEIQIAKLLSSGNSQD